MSTAGASSGTDLVPLGHLAVLWAHCNHHQKQVLGQENLSSVESLPISVEVRSSSELAVKATKRGIKMPQLLRTNPSKQSSARVSPRVTNVPESSSKLPPAKQAGPSKPECVKSFDGLFSRCCIQMFKMATRIETELADENAASWVEMAAFELLSSSSPVYDLLALASFYEKSSFSPSQPNRAPSGAAPDRLQQRLGSFSSVRIRDLQHALSLLLSAHRYRCYVTNTAYTSDLPSRSESSFASNASEPKFPADSRFSSIPSVSDRPVRPYSVMFVQLSLITTRPLRSATAAPGPSGFERQNYRWNLSQKKDALSCATLGRSYSSTHLTLVDLGSGLSG